MIGARMLAYQILLHIDQNASHPDRLMRVMLRRHSHLHERDRALVTELVYGVLRWQAKLDWCIDQLSKIKPRKIESSVRLLLRMALYQIIFLDRIPAHAAVNETVKIAKATQPAYIVKFVNALLRAAVRRGDDWNYPSRDNDPAAFLAVTTSHPEWFVRRCIKEIGLEETERFCNANNTVAPLVLRINVLRTGTVEVLGALREIGVHAERSPYIDDAIRVWGLRHDLGEMSVFKEGWVQVQDEASQLVCHLLAPQPEARVLDLCCGFGGKTTHLGILMKNRGEIAAIDHSAWKLDELKENAKRQGMGIIRVHESDILEISAKDIGTFDYVLLDAPCTGFGSIRRNPDIKWSRNPKDPYRFSLIQKKLLKHAAQFVRAGGALVYATCTVFKEENELVAGEVFQDDREWVLEAAARFLPSSCRSMIQGPFLRTWPHKHGIDGFFATRWRRR